MSYQSKLASAKIFIIISLTVIALISLVYGLSYYLQKEHSPVTEAPDQESDQEPEEESEKDEAEKISLDNVWPGNEIIFPSLPTSIIFSKDLIGSKDIFLADAQVTAQVPEYNLPLDTEEISNWDEISQKIELSSQALSLLEKNGFAVISSSDDFYNGRDDFAMFYSILEAKGIPVFITSDSLLHYYHIFFDTTLMNLEMNIFYPDVWEMSRQLLEESVRQYEQEEGDLKEAAKRNVVFSSVALTLLSPEANQLATKDRIEEECYLGYGYLEDDNHENPWESFYFKDTCEPKIDFKYFSKAEFEKYNFEIPDFAKDLVEEEIKLIEAHADWAYSPTFIYKEDYSQYVPRGHYTKSEKLKNYFKVMMWYGRMSAVVKGSDLISPGKSLRRMQEEGAQISIDDAGALLSSYDARIQTLQASLIANEFSQNQNIRGRWTRMYAITSFFVGFSDDLGPLEYSQTLKALLGENVSGQTMIDNYSQLESSLLNFDYNPKIYSGLDQMTLTPPFSSAQAQQFLRATKGLRFMGQRFTVDSWLFSEIVSPYSGVYTGSRMPRPFTSVKTAANREVRGFPRGLDIMALFGSQRAKEILEELGDTEYLNYEEKFSALKQNIDSFSLDEWSKNLYWNWLYVLKSLLLDFDNGYPTFMQTKAWQDKELNTALASWSELRHDTILYVKQSYTGAEKGGVPEPKVVGYVEPVPEFYARLLNLTEMTSSGLENLVPTEELEKLKVKPSLDKFSEILTKLLAISKKELENKSLSDEEYLFIKYFGDTSQGLIEGLLGKGLGSSDYSDLFKTVLVADVHTDGNTKQVLEEGVGYIKTMPVAYKLPEGHILVGVGPVFSYYEFKQPMKARLTDEAWRQKLDINPPPEPEWIKSFSE